MIMSMTGFGRGGVSTEIGHLTVEVKSVNSRGCNIITKLPETLSSLELKVINYIRSRVKRGQVNVTIDIDRSNLPDGRTVVVDMSLARQYFDQLTEMKERLSLTDPISLGSVAELPGVVNVEDSVGDIDEIWTALENALAIAMDQLIEMREVEGEAMMIDVLLRLENMLNLTTQISERAPEVVDEYRQRLQKRITELMKDEIEINESRLAMEVAVMAERSDINEELVRLRSHISQLRSNLENSEGPVGRHLDFILQEINREVNTIASKASDFWISSDCIKFKDEIEKLREQVQNIE